MNGFESQGHRYYAMIVTVEAPDPKLAQTILHDRLNGPGFDFVSEPWKVVPTNDSREAYENDGPEFEIGDMIDQWGER